MVINLATAKRCDVLSTNNLSVNERMTDIINSKRAYEGDNLRVPYVFEF